MSHIRVNVKKIENIRKQDEMYNADYYFTYPKGKTVYVCKTLQLPSLGQFLKIAITRKVWLKDEVFDKEEV